MQGQRENKNILPQNTAFPFYQPQFLLDNRFFPINQYPQYDFNINPFQNVCTELEAFKGEYFRLQKENQTLKANLASVIHEKQRLEETYNTIKVPAIPRPVEKIIDDRKKRHRRSANQIMRQFTCFQEGCDKSYGTQASLIQHIKLKHKQFMGSKQYELKIMALRKQLIEQQEAIIEVNEQQSNKECSNAENKEQQLINEK